MKLLSAVSILSTIHFGVSFSTYIPTATLNKQRTSSYLSSALPVATETFFHAVELAEGRHTASIEELDKLATELEEFIGCKYEEDSGPEVCEKEIQDRIEVAQILRLKIELKLRVEMLKTSNLFAADVIKEHNAEKRKKFKAALLANREKSEIGSDLGLW